MDVMTFLNNELYRPFEWGETDCATTADRWFKYARGFSAMEHYGRTVVNETYGRAWLAQPGGLFRATKNIMSHADIEPLRESPIAGDIGIVVVSDKVCVAIFDGTHWRSRDEDGFIFANDHHRVAAWEVSTCRKH